MSKYRVYERDTLKKRKTGEKKRPNLNPRVNPHRTRWLGDGPPPSKKSIKDQISDRRRMSKEEKKERQAKPIKRPSPPIEGTEEHTKMIAEKTAKKDKTHKIKKTAKSINKKNAEEKKKKGQTN